MIYYTGDSLQTYGAVYASGSMIDRRPRLLSVVAPKNSNAYFLNCDSVPANWESVDGKKRPEKGQNMCVLVYV